jgi:DNA topoisomerase-1
VSNAKSLVIVESPAKAKTIAGYLGPDFIVESSIGHIRDLPKGASDVPAEYKGTSVGRLGVDVDHDFKPIYVVDSHKKDHIKRLKELLKGVDQLYLATDEDREGESIAWHLLEVLKPKVPVKRMAFHEITKKAILAAMENPRDVDRRLVDAQEARRILDRLYGYEVSPVLWKKVMPKLSAGRVQSVATRIVVERENERLRFVRAAYWDVEGKFTTPRGESMTAYLSTVDGQRVATGKDFGSDGKLTKKGDIVLLDQAAATTLVENLETAAFTVKQVERKPNRRSPAPPFMTSTLQQEAGRKLRFSSQRAMRAAQNLYEAGFITYMRTDSTTLSDTALNAARKLIEAQYGAEYLPKAPRVYRNKVKNAQEAHEAIRPAGDEFQSPQSVASRVGPDEAKLYELIWKRTVASQMEDSRGESVKLTIATNAGGKPVEFTASGHTITFPGFLRAYVEGSDDPDADLDQKEVVLPAVTESERLDGSAFEPRSHETQPPARYTEASLVKRLEELGVGRPSTYASILSTIQARGYVWKKGSALVPSFKAFAVIQLLEQHFGSLVDYQFTARMEDELDAIAAGDEQSVPWLSRFYFGVKAANDTANASAPQKNGTSKTELTTSELDAGLRQLVAERLERIDARAINSLSLGKDSSGTDIIIRVGRFGPYLQRGEDTANIPEDLPPDELNVSKAEELLATPSGDRLLGNDPESGLPVYARSGRFGSYIQLGEAGGKEKPKTASMLKTMTVDSITLEQALELLALPRHVGNDPETGLAITAQLGRFGPYLSREKETRSLESEELVFTVTLDEALALFKQPKQRGQRKAATPLKTLGNDAVSGGEMTVREGRFGLYVTDGETNASFRKGDSLENITPERAMELLQERRERGPVTKKKASKKKAASKSEAVGGAEKASKKPAKAKKAGSKKAATKKASKAKAAETETLDEESSETEKPASKSSSAKRTAKAASKTGSKNKATKKAAKKKAVKQALSRDKAGSEEE